MQGETLLSHPDMYQLRRKSQKLKEEEVRPWDESSIRSSSESDSDVDDKSDKSFDTGCHINTSYIEDTTVMPTIQLHNITEQKAKLVDAAMQTSGEWTNILTSYQPQECSSLLAHDDEATVKTEAIEMKALSCREGTHTYSNKAYESDVPTSTLTSDISSSQKSEPATNTSELLQEDTPPNALSTCDGSNKTETARFSNKSVKFSGCQIINDSNTRLPHEHINHHTTRHLSTKHKWYAHQLRSAEAKWYKIREMELQQQGEILSYKGKVKSVVRDVAFAQARHPLNPVNFYFEVTILKTGTENYIAIGLTSKHYPSYEMPGWKGKSVGYHGDDGKLYIGRETGLDFGPKLQKGDVLTCGLLFTQNWTSIHTRSQRCFTYKNTIISAFEDPMTLADSMTDGMTAVKMFVMLNGQMLGIKMIGLVFGEYYPTVGLLSEGAAVKVDLLPDYN